MCLNPRLSPPGVLAFGEARMFRNTNRPQIAAGALLRGQPFAQPHDCKRVPLATLGRSNSALIEFGRCLVRRHVGEFGEDRPQSFGSAIGVIAIGNRLGIGATQLHTARLGGLQCHAGS